VNGRARIGLALGANIGAVAVAVAGSAWLWARAAESGLPPTYGHSPTPVVEDAYVPLAVDPRGRAPFERRVVVPQRARTVRAGIRKPVRVRQSRPRPARRPAQPVAWSPSTQPAPQLVTVRRRRHPRHLLRRLRANVAAAPGACAASYAASSGGTSAFP